MADRRVIHRFVFDMPHSVRLRSADILFCTNSIQIKMSIFASFEYQSQLCAVSLPPQFAIPLHFCIVDSNVIACADDKATHLLRISLRSEQLEIEHVALIETSFMSNLYSKLIQRFDSSQFDPTHLCSPNHIVGIKAVVSSSGQSYLIVLWALGTVKVWSLTTRSVVQSLQISDIQPSKNGPGTSGVFVLGT